MENNVYLAHFFPRDIINPLFKAFEQPHTLIITNMFMRML